MRDARMIPMGWLAAVTLASCGDSTERSPMSTGQGPARLVFGQAGVGSVLVEEDDVRVELIEYWGL